VAREPIREDAHALTGIPGTKPDHHAAPYSLTEDFITVYRMHPLIPDDYTFIDFRDGNVLGVKSFDVIGAMEGITFTSIPLGQALLYWALPVGSALMLIALVEGLVRDWPKRGA